MANARYATPVDFRLCSIIRKKEMSFPSRASVAWEGGREKRMEQEHRTSTLASTLTSTSSVFLIAQTPAAIWLDGPAHSIGLLSSPTPYLLGLLL